MSQAIDAIIDRIHDLELELDAEFAKQRAGLKFGLERGVAQFEVEVVRRQRELRKGLARFLLTAPPLFILTAPVIYSLILPFAVVDLWVSAYQAICFRVYGIPQVRRSRYMVFDRAGLPYLNAIEKLNCAYCSYVNGVIAYVREVGARTEQFWCPIKHARRVLGQHARQARFEDFGEAETYQIRQQELRAALRAEGDGAAG